MLDIVSPILEKLPQRVNLDSNLRHLGRHCSTDFMIEIGETPFHFEVKSGEMSPVLRGPFNMRTWKFAIRAPEGVWSKFWSPVPEPGFNDIFAMTAYGHAKIEGDIRPLMTDLRFIKEVIALPRGEVS